MDILRIATAGSVDDGKSTLIGRLLFDTKSITKDKLEAVEGTSKRKGLQFTDLSLLTDGLIAEREQGITIDVAHIYFSTEKRKYIIADTPGHVEYTRNMITGASNAQAAVILIDARNGVWEQTKRHLFIFSLLRIENIFVCVNKMDLVNYDEETFSSIKADIENIASTIGYNGKLIFIPIAAKDGDNVVTKSSNLAWYSGEPLLNYLEVLPIHVKDELLPARLPVQLVIRPQDDDHHDFRGYAGKITSGSFTVGEQVKVLPSMNTSKIKSIYSGDKKIDSGKPGDSVLIELEDDIDVSRGNMIISSGNEPAHANVLTATINWMDEEKLSTVKTYLLQHGVNIVKAKITSILSVIDMATMLNKTSEIQFGLNDIGRVNVKTSKPMFADVYKSNPGNGVFILIDEFSNKTVATGFIESFE